MLCTAQYYAHVHVCVILYMYITCVKCTVVVELHLATSGLQSPAK